MRRPKGAPWQANPALQRFAPYCVRVGPVRPVGPHHKDALALLVADHNRVRGLFARFQEAEEAGGAAQLAELGATILTELDVDREELVAAVAPE